MLFPAVAGWVQGGKQAVNPWTSSLPQVQVPSVDNRVHTDPGPVMGVVVESLPGAPLSLAVSAVSSSQLKLTWKDGSSNEDGFQIERCAGSNCTNFAQVATAAANMTTYSNTGLTKKTPYSYRLRAYNGAGYSSYTTVVSKATLR